MRRIVDSVFFDFLPVKSPWLSSLHGDQHILAPVKDKASTLVLLGEGDASTTRIPAGAEHQQGHQEEERRKSAAPPWDAETGILFSQSSLMHSCKHSVSEDLPGIPEGSVLHQI